jgi:transcription initiation factor TFIID subunit 10
MFNINEQHNEVDLSSISFLYIVDCDGSSHSSGFANNFTNSKKQEDTTTRKRRGQIQPTMSQNEPKIAEESMDVDIDIEDDEIFNDTADVTEQTNGGEHKDNDAEDAGAGMPELPEFTRKDKTLHEVLSMMEDYYPIVS